MCRGVSSKTAQDNRHTDPTSRGEAGGSATEDDSVEMQHLARGSRDRAPGFQLELPGGGRAQRGSGVRWSGPPG